MKHEAAMMLVNSFNEDERCYWNERAAIREYDGGLERQEAEIEAVKDVLVTRKKTPAQGEW